MFGRLVSRLREVLTSGERPSRASSILLPFLIISVALGALAWRSYQLSERMEHGANRLAMQYAGYAADTAARRLDSAVRDELLRVSEQWQQLERGTHTPTEEVLHQWVDANDWIVSAIYVPDADPAGSVFASAARPRETHTRLTREFYTAGGTVRYTYDPPRLLTRVRGGVDLQPLFRANAVGSQVRIDILPTNGQGPVPMPDGFGFVAPLAQPLASYSIRAFVPVAYDVTGWRNARMTSVFVSILALLLAFIGGFLAMRGIRREEETMKLRGALIANVSHELRTPLSMIRLGAETLKRSTKLTEKQRHDIEESILREVLHLSHLVENVLDVARIQHRQAKALAFTPVYPRELVASVIATYESWIRSKGFEVVLQIDDTVDEQLWDRDAVSRALLNLIDNAMKYSADEKLLQVALRQSDEHVIIEVRDRGIGIAGNDIDRIFDPYYRAQFSDTQTRRGAGLGLTLVQQILSSHGGRIEVVSAPGEGSTFRLLFPRSRSTSQQPLPRFAHAPQAF